MDILKQLAMWSWWLWPLLLASVLFCFFFFIIIFFFSGELGTPNDHPDELRHLSLRSFCKQNDETRCLLCVLYVFFINGTIKCSWSWWICLTIPASSLFIYFFYFHKLFMGETFWGLKEKKLVTQTMLERI
jgi:hypothetical protein